MSTLIARLGSKVIWTDDGSEVIFAPWYWNDLEKMSPAERAEAIKNRVADECGVTVEQIHARCKSSRIAAIRHRAISEVALANPKWTLKRLAKCFHRYDHSTIHNALKRHGVSRPPHDSLMRRVWALWNEGKGLTEICNIVEYPIAHVALAFDRARARNLRGEL